MHVMIDIETLGTTHDSIMLQIGAVGFAIGGMDPGFYANVTVQDQISLGRKADLNTVAWWLDKTSPEARLSVFERQDIDKKSLRDALEGLNAYVQAYLINDTSNNTPNDRIWANSPAFDLAIIRSAMEMCSITPVWKYWQEADVRTLKLIDGAIQGVEIKKIPTNHTGGILHDALDDAKNQALYVSNFLHEITKKQ